VEFDIDFFANMSARFGITYRAEPRHYFRGVGPLAPVARGAPVRRALLRRSVSHVLVRDFEG
jgi:hypothetical protein